MAEHTHSPFTDRTSLADAQQTLHEVTPCHERTETVPLSDAVGRVLATDVTAPQAVPHYKRAAMDGYAVRAEDTFGASDRSPAFLQTTDETVEASEARQVHTGSELPDGADAVVMIEHVEEVGEEIEVFQAVGEEENVAPVGEDVSDGQHLYEQGTRLRASDLGLLKSVGLTAVTIFEQPTVSVIPTGEELVQADPEPGEIIETNGLTVSQLVRQWGGVPTYNDIVTDDKDELAAAIRDATDHDIVVTTGGSSVGARDLLPEVVSELGEVLVHGVGIKPGHPVAFGVVEETPVLMLPGYPVSCFINAVQFLRPALTWTGGTTPEPFPGVRAALTEKIYSEPGIRSFARVQLTARDGETDEPSRPQYEASSVRASGAGVLSSVSLSDGWVVVPENSEGIDEGETVTVERWEWLP